jgi:UDP-N-acetylglucosamine acyltransferase
MTAIHPTAIIDPNAVIGADVKIGPYCVIGPHVRLGDRVHLKAHVVIDGHTVIGEDTVVYPFASLGQETPDLKYKGEPSALIIGKRCKIREYVTMNPGTAAGIMRTQVGDDCLFMPSSHVAHDCIVGNKVIMANSAALGGHVELGDHVIVGGLAAVHQYVRVGAHAMIGGMTGVKNDVIPYGLVMDDTGYLAGLNYVGLERRGYTKEQVQTLLKSFRRLFEGDGTFAERMERVANDFSAEPDVMHMIDFIKAKDSRNILQPRVGT